MTRAALIIVDCQNDFLSGGSLAVEQGDQILAPIRLLLQDLSWEWALVVASEDYHPPGHISFASRHSKTPFETLSLHKPNGEEYTQLMWPDHCIQGSSGAEIESGLRDALGKYGGEVLLARKGYDQEVETYSAFSGYLSPLHSPAPPPDPIRPFDDSPSSISRGALAQALRGRDVDRVVVVGLALEVCVGATAMDAVRSGWKTAIVKPLTRGVQREKYESVEVRFTREGGTMLGNAPGDWEGELRSWIDASHT